MIKRESSTRTDRFLRIFLCAILFFLCSTSIVSAQEIMTASSLFDSISKRYEQIRDFSAEFTLQRTGSPQKGVFSFLYPEYLRLSFSQPAGQELISDGNVFSVYIPQSNVVLQQEYNSSKSATGLATPEGLRLMKERYSIAYLSGAELQPFEDNPEILVYALQLTWKYKTDGLRSITLYVDEDLLIRKIDATTANYKELALIFDSITINTNLTEAFFKFDLPGSASVVQGFLFE